MDLAREQHGLGELPPERAEEGLEARVRRAFAPGWALSQAFPGYQERPIQTDLAAAVARSIERGEHFLGEAGCGTGKSFAYLIPATLHAAESGERVVVATANIALQEQLVGKDLPFLQKALPWEFTFALLKGVNNYLCLLKRSEIDRGLPFPPGTDADREAEDLQRWAARTETGDVSELAFQPRPDVWRLFSTTSEECLGGDCPFASDCHALRAREEAKEADVVVTNYHVLCADIQVRRLSAGRASVLPEHDLFIGDEAHRLPEVARDFFEESLSERAFRAVARQLRKKERAREADALERAAGDFFHEVGLHARSGPYRSAGILTRPNWFTGRTAEALARAAGEAHEVLKSFSRRAGADEGDPRAAVAKAQARRVVEQARKTGRLLDDMLALGDAGRAYFIQESDRGGQTTVRLVSKPVNPAPTLREGLFAERPCVLLSATITADRRFDWFRSTSGCPPCPEVIVDSPFDFERQALFYVPDDIDSPAERDGRWEAQFTDLVNRVVAAADGRTMVLCTSNRMCRLAAERIETLGHTLLVQGRAPRTQLIRRFKEDAHSVLVATKSFFEGIDVPGQALTALVIDKIPFPSPDDPVVAKLRLDAPDGFFGKHLVPTAVITFRQAFGRLIRAETDWGVVVCGDKRLLEGKSYGRTFMRSLPKLPVTRKFADLEAFIDLREGRTPACAFEGCA